jgi:abortive infection bacteriophage resistance protein
MKYDKPPLSFTEQIDLLKTRGMEIPEPTRAARYLAHLNYYRLRAYWLPFEENESQNSHRFRAGTTFDQTLNLYVFDRKFRLLILEAIERVEVSFRTQFAYGLAMKYDSHAYLRADIFKSADDHAELMTSFQEELDRSKETFIEHYKQKYNDPASPPIWAACEIMSFGLLSKWYQKIKNRADRKLIATTYDLDDKILASFIHHLSHVRNLAAHHCRLWNRLFTVTMSIPTNPPELAGQMNSAADRNIYNTLVMLGYLLNIMSPGSTWHFRLKRLIEETATIDPAAMGFPENWQQLKLWTNAENK